MRDAKEMAQQVGETLFAVDIASKEQPLQERGGGGMQH